MADVDDIVRGLALLPFGKPVNSATAAEHNRQRYPDLMARLDRLASLSTLTDGEKR